MIYCNQACQKMHWFTHKKVCKKLQEQREKQEAESAKLRMQQSKGILICLTDRVKHYHTVDTHRIEADYHPKCVTFREVIDS